MKKFLSLFRFIKPYWFITTLFGMYIIKAYHRIKEQIQRFKKINGIIRNKIKRQHKSWVPLIHLSHALGNMNEHILGAEVVTLFNQEKKQWHTFNTRNRCYKKADFQAEVVSSSLAPLNRFFNNMARTLMVGVGAIMTVYGMGKIGTIASFSAYSRQFFKPTEQLSNALNSLQAAYAGVKRVFEVLDVLNEFAKDQEKNIFKRN